jgi:hypothetical protein
MHGLYLLWWVQGKHLSPATVGTVIAAGELAIVFLELPTGWFADRFGHRFSLIVGSLVQTVAMVVCWLAEGAAGLLLATLLVAVGDAFRSGADEALLYRTCLALDRERDFQRIQGRVAAIELGALVVLVLAGGLIVRVWGFAAGWMAETLLCAAGAAIALAMVEPPAAADDPQPAVVTARGAALFSRSSFLLIFPAALLGGMAGAAAFYLQTGPDADAGAMTVMVAAITLAEAAGSAMAAWLPEAGVRAQLGLAILGGAVLAVALAAPATIVAVVCVLAFLYGLADPLRAAAIQRTADDGQRARAASLANLCDMTVTTIVLPLAGLARRE